MKFVLAFMAAIAIGLAVEADLFIGVMLVFTLAVSYLLLIRSELLTFVEYVHLLLAGEIDGIHSNPAVTQDGSEAFILANALAYRIDTLHWEADANMHQLIELPTESFVNELENSSIHDIAEMRSEGFQERLTEYMCRRFRCDMAVIITSGKVYSHHVLTKRFKDAVIREYSNPGSPVDWKEHISSLTGSSSAFIAFGIESCIVEPFKLFQRTGFVNGMLWMGYSAEKRYTEAEAEHVSRVLRQVEVELGSLQRAFEFKALANKSETKSKMRANLIAHMSHDFRSPINNILSILHLFKLEGISDENKDLLEVALLNCRAMGELVEDLLDYSKHQSGELAAETKVVDVRPLVDRVCNEFAFAAGGKEVLLKTDLQEVSSVEVDPRHLRRILSNVVGNAIKYTREGSVTVAVHEREGSVVLSVVDTGPGIEKASLGELFKPFTRLDKSTVDGVGLGLSITKALLEANKAKFKVDSQPGNGTCFELSLPVAIRDKVNQLAA